MNRPSGLLSLDDDVLLAIFSFLNSNAALSTASTSQRAYRLAISSFFADIYFGRRFDTDEQDGSESLGLSRYMRAPEPLSQVPRIRHLRHFIIGHVNEVDLPPLYGLLFEALNLRTIEIRNMEFFIDNDGLVTKAIGAMHHLEQADFAQCGPATVSAFPELLSSQKLTSLTLYFDEDIVDLPTLFLGLSSAPGIRTLDIALIYLPIAPPMRPSHNFSLSSIRHLTLTSFPGPVPAYIVTLCPNIETLSLRLFSRDNTPATFSMSAEDRWPSQLKELSLPIRITIAEDTVQRMKPVSCLSFGGETPIPSGADFEESEEASGSDSEEQEAGRSDFEDLLRLFETFRSTVLELHTKSVLAEAGRMWDTLRGAAPQLRSLSIAVEDGKCNVREYVDPLVAALRSTSLIYLSLHFPRPSWSVDFSSMAEVDSICAPEIQRAETLRALPLRLTEAVPSLRVLALSSCKLGRVFNWGVCHDLAGPRMIAEIGTEEGIQRQWGPGSESLNAPMRKISELGAEFPRDERWWWVEGEGAARTLIEIWREDGERARDLIRRADFDPEKSLDGFYSDKCRYER
ncbi:uncharacterized protein BXZ73DRAFT_104858 [Epithele typhae]|uniref:uncharacterized protein n=1 Tax=Epithele typhae TaxID=378194 RepID=UPI002007E704|nr:uncharacterized protein BXZ73DRAFT_104858 [Epithele typhae]KAH9919753.1 hypothetical protein BXZ73DRAFT_104858 [Epithele typhae]